MRFQILSKRIADGVRDDKEHQVPVSETDFTLGWVHVDVEFHVRHVQEQYRYGLALRSIRLVCLRNGLAHHLVFDGTVPHEKELVVALAVRFGRGRDIACYMDACFGVINGEQPLGDLGADGFGDAAAEFSGNACEDRPIANFIVKTDFRVRNGGL